MVSVRKTYLVDEVPDIFLNSVIIDESYLSITPVIKIMYDGSDYYLVFKDNVSEVKRVIDEGTYNILSNMIKGNTLTYRLSGGIIFDLEYYVREYEGLLKGLITAEIVYPNVLEVGNYELPQWIGEEITDNRKYDISNLIRNDGIDVKSNDNKAFIKRLSVDQLKTLVALVLADADQTEMIKYLTRCYGPDDVTLEMAPKSKWDENQMLLIKSFIGHGQGRYTPYFKLDDYSMFLYDGYSSKDSSGVLQKYLSSQFGKEYVDALIKKHLNDLMDEESELLDGAEQFFRDDCYAPHAGVAKKILKNDTE